MWLKSLINLPNAKEITIWKKNPNRTHTKIQVISPNFNILDLYNLVYIYILIPIHYFTLQSYPFSDKQTICNYKLLTTIQRKAMRIKLGELKLQIQHNSYQNPRWTLACRNWQTDPKIHKEVEETLGSPNNLGKEQSWKSNNS